MGLISGGFKLAGSYAGLTAVSFSVKNLHTTVFPSNSNSSSDSNSIASQLALGGGLSLETFNTVLQK